MQLKKFLLFGLMAAVLPAVAEEAADRKTATSLKYVEHELDTRQNKFTAEQNKAMEYTNAAGTVEKRAVTSELGSNTSDTSLPMVGGVNTKLNQKQDDIDPVNDHTAVTYTGQPGGIGRKGIYQDTGTYADQSDNLIDAKTFNAALKKGLDSEFLCSAYQPGTNICWVYAIHNNKPVKLNLFDMSLIPTGQWIVHNADGSITVTAPAGDSGRYIGKTLSQLAPELQAGKNYKFSINTTGTAYIHLTSPANVGWNSGAVKTITQDMLNSYVRVYANGENTTATIYDIQITDENPEMPFETLVPEGYTPLEYIQSDGSQMINTGIGGLNTGDWKIYVKWMITGGPTGNWPLVCGVYAGETANAYRIIGHSQYTELYYVNGNSRASSGGVNFSGQQDKIHEGTIRNGSVTFDRLTKETLMQGTTIPASETIKLLRASASSAGLVGRIYAAYAKQDGVMKYNYIPARRDSDNKVGMWDTVSRTFKTNSANDNNFAPGPVVQNNVYIPQNQ